MPKILLTDIAVRSLRADERTDFWDTRTPGFGVRAGPREKTYIVKHGGTRRTIGAVGEISLQDARKQAYAIKGADRPLQRVRLSLQEAYDRFNASHISLKKPSTALGYRRVMEKYLLPALATKRLSRITYEDIAKITDPLIKTPGEQAHVLGIIRTFFRWCIRPPSRFIPYSPIEGVRVRVGPSRSRVLNDDELQAVWRAADRQGYPHGFVIKLLLLTGQRKSEIGSLSWSWINELERTITMPASVNKNNRAHTFPYTTPGQGIHARLSTGCRHRFDLPRPALR